MTHPSPTMPFLLLAALLVMTAPTTTLFDFDRDTDPAAWQVQDDVVMGGKSSGHFELTDEGHGRFHGEVALANNGGFSSIIHAFDEPRDVGEAEAFRLRVRGDGATYTFRVKSDPGQRYYHEAEFATEAGEWRTVEVPFAEMTLASIEAADPSSPTVEEVPYSGVQFVAIPEFTGMATAVGGQFAEVLADELSAEEALANSQWVIERQMEHAEVLNKE